MNAKIIYAVLISTYPQYPNVLIIYILYMCNINKEAKKNLYIFKINLTYRRKTEYIVKVYEAGNPFTIISIYYKSVYCCSRYVNSQYSS